MQDFNRIFGQTAQWVQPKFSQRCFELRTPADTLAALEFKSAFGSLASAKTSANHWTFKRVGFFNTRVTVRAEGSEIDLAVFRPRWTGTEGVLEFASGQSYRWKVANFWATQFQFLDGSGQPLVVFQQGVEDPGFSDVFKIQSRVEVGVQGHNLADLPLLALLGFYLIILHHDDTAAVTAAAAT